MNFIKKISGTLLNSFSIGKYVLLNYNSGNLKITDKDGNMVQVQASNIRTPQYNQTFTTTADEPPRFTINHTTYVADSLRLYRNTARQTLNIDYTISGRTIILTRAFETGDILRGDYDII